MKRWKKWLGALLSLSILCGAAAPALAADYTYTITFHSGMRGTFASQGVRVQGSEYTMQADKYQIKLSGLKKGAVVSFDPSCVSVNSSDDRYYIKGIRLSGRDNSTVSASAITLNGQSAYDQDYVVAYGVKAASVAYTVNYRDTSGKTLKSSRTYYGNIGDKPVAAYVYIEGYKPQAYNITKTLSENEANNVFTFQYTSASTKTSKTSTSKTVNTAADADYQAIQLDTQQAGEPALLLDLDAPAETVQTNAQHHGAAPLVGAAALCTVGGAWLLRRRKRV